jgi:CheY-like chemotaxis protein
MITDPRIARTACHDVSVVVVEDHDDSREFLVLELQTFGARVIGARNATQALRYMRTVKPDVLVTDLSMPEQDGFELLQELRSSPYLKNVPAIAITGHGDLREKVGRSGFQWFMRQPIDALELCRVIGALTRGGRAHPE